MRDVRVHIRVETILVGCRIHPQRCRLLGDKIDLDDRFDAFEAIFPGHDNAQRARREIVGRRAGRCEHERARRQRAAFARGRSVALDAARQAFYRGDIAQKIVKFQKENGGFLSAADLADYRSGIASPVETSFGGIRLYGCGPWCQGPSLLQALNLLDASLMRSLGHNSPG